MKIVDKLVATAAKFRRAVLPHDAESVERRVEKAAERYDAKCGKLYEQQLRAEDKLHAKGVSLAARYKADIEEGKQRLVVLAETREERFRREMKMHKLHIKRAKAAMRALQSERREHIRDQNQELVRLYHLGNRV